jgi:hypothetical protein
MCCDVLSWPGSDCAAASPLPEPQCVNRVYSPVVYSAPLEFPVLLPAGAVSLSCLSVRCDFASGNWEMRAANGTVRFAGSSGACVALNVGSMRVNCSMLPLNAPLPAPAAPSCVISAAAPNSMSVLSLALAIALGLALSRANEL